MKHVHYYNPINKVERVTDEQARKIVKTGVARYISKRLYRKLVKS